jgi:peptide deformylase
MFEVLNLRMSFRIFIMIGVLMTISTPVQASEKSTSLPEYIVFDPLKDTSAPKVLRAVAKKCNFPLKAQDKKGVQLLIGKFDAEENCAGLAAPQIGISKRIIVFALLDEPELETKAT